jgi:hypothetical protein
VVVAAPPAPPALVAPLVVVAPLPAPPPLVTPVPAEPVAVDEATELEPPAPCEAPAPPVVDRESKRSPAALPLHAADTDATSTYPRTPERAAFDIARDSNGNATS